jgi:hypothetical protein
MQLASQKAELLVNVLTAELGLLVLLFGRRYKASWRSHPQGIMIGLSTVAIAQMLRDGVWELIALKAAPHSQAEYERLVGLREKMFNASEVVFLVVVVWWIACLWMDEPGVVAVGAVEIPASQEADVETGAGSEIAEEQSDV